jgi:hypothetical protein
MDNSNPLIHVPHKPFFGFWRFLDRNFDGPIHNQQRRLCIWKVLRNEVCRSTAKPKTKTKGKRAYSADARQKLQERMASVRQPRPPEQRRLLNGLWWSGLRLGEAFSLSWDDEAPITVDVAGQGGTMRIPAKLQKSKKDGIEPIVPEFVRFLHPMPKALTLLLTLRGFQVTPRIVRSRKLLTLTELSNEPVGTRTRDLRIKSPLLYRLSYRLFCSHGAA